MMIENVDWQILSKCNRNCKYCFGPKNCKELSFSEIKYVIDILFKYGVKQIGLTGGEPLLYSNFEELVEYISSKGILIYLSTNCDFYSKYKDIIKEKVSIIGIPVDGSNKIIHDSIRGKGSYNAVFQAIQDIYKSNSNLKIKIGTVITNNNLFDLLNIEKSLAEYNEKIIFWKLYELISYKRNMQGVLELTPKVNWIKEIHQFGQFIEKNKIIIDSKAERDKSYFFIKPNANVFIPVLSNDFSYEKDLGNLIKDDYELIYKRFTNMANIEGYNKSFRYMKINREDNI